MLIISYLLCTPFQDFKTDQPGSNIERATTAITATYPPTALPSDKLLVLVRFKFKFLLPQQQQQIKSEESRPEG